MGIKSEEISSLIKKRIKDFDVPILSADVGIVTEVGDGIAQIYGLKNAQALELLEFKGGTKGVAFNLEEDSVGAIILGPFEEIKEGDEVRTTGKIMQVPVGEALVGRVVNPLGEPIDGKGPIETGQASPIEKVAPGVISRQPVDTPLQTGIKAIDAMIPIGRGQRELIHRRPADRQDGDRARHHHQPEGPGRDLHLRRHRAAGGDRRPGGRHARGARRPRVHHHRGGHGQ